MNQLEGKVSEENSRNRTEWTRLGARVSWRRRMGWTLFVCLFSYCLRGSQMTPSSMSTQPKVFFFFSVGKWFFNEIVGMYIIRCSINLWRKMTSIRESESSRKDFCGEARREKPKTDELSLRRVFSICTFLRFSPTSQVKETRNRRRRNKKNLLQRTSFLLPFLYLCWLIRSSVLMMTR